MFTLDKNLRLKAIMLIGLTLATVHAIPKALAAESLPIADAHVHYSHDSVELTPPARVIELMRAANLKFALVSSSDDNGTQLLSELAPELIIPGLRPYRRRGETGTWFTEPEALAYVEKLLATNRYASIGEFHLYGENADLDIPRRIVQLADDHNLILHAHSDADAVERLLAQSPTVKVLWAHSGFDAPEDIAVMLDKHDRLWADLAFRSDMSAGGKVGADWKSLFTAFPDRIMLGTDTYTPERMYFVPEHAEASRVWLKDLPDDIAENIAWKNAYALLMPVWKENQQKTLTDTTRATLINKCAAETDDIVITDEALTVRIRTLQPIEVSKPVSVHLTLCGKNVAGATMNLDARMPAHGHGTNYTPEQTVVDTSDDTKTVQVDGLVLHMPGQWQWTLDITSNNQSKSLTHDFIIE